MKPITRGEAERSKRLSTAARCAVLSVLLLAAPVTSSFAQAVAPRPTVTRAADVFENTPDRVVAGSRLVLKTRGTQVAQRIVRSGLQVRVFSLSDEQSRPVPVSTVADCDVYVSVVLRMDGSSGAQAVIATLDHSWLNLSDSQSSILPGRYYFVFEQAGPAAEQFRLKRTDTKDYFDTGFLLVVDKSDSISLNSVRASYFERRAKLGQVRLEIDEKSPVVPCYTYRRLVAEYESKVELAQAPLELCDGNVRAGEQPIL